MPKYIKDKEKLAARIKLIRQRAELTQQEVADKLFLDRSTYAYYEIGKISIPFFTLLELAEIFGVQFEQLVSGEEEFKIYHRIKSSADFIL